MGERAGDMENRANPDQVVKPDQLVRGIGEWVPAADLVPWDRNPKAHPVENVAGIARSIKRFGFAAPIVAWRSRRQIVAGHGRLLAAQLLYREDPGQLLATDQPGPGLVPVRFLEFASDGEAAALAIADNRFTEANPMDDGVVADLLRELQASGTSIEGLGYDDALLKELLAPPPVEPSADDDDAPEPPAEPVSRLGEVYELGPHRLVCGDSRSPEVWAKLLQNGERPAAINTDPPYGMNLKTDNRHKKANMEGNVYRPVIGDDAQFDAGVFMDAFSDVEEQFWWGADYYRKTIDDGGSWHVWDKRVEGQEDMFGNAFELCWSKKMHKRKVYRHLWVGYAARERDESRVHPTQKPIKLACDMLNDVGLPGAIVADFFGGSGYTMMACAQTNRIARLVELDPRYCDVIRRRWTVWAKKNDRPVGTGGLE
jgi:DNA modification methylase